MGKYYGVIRAPALSHAVERGSGGGTAVYKNHKYIARAMTSSGKYRYFYDTAELAAYKQEKTLRKTSDNPAAAGSSTAKSLREKWEERQGMLGATGSGKGGSGGSGGGSGRGSGGSGGSGGGSGSSSSKKVIKVKGGKTSQKGFHASMSAGARINRGENTPAISTPGPAGLIGQDTTKKKKKKKTSGSKSTTRLVQNVINTYYRR